MDYIPIAEPVPSDEEADPDAPLAVVVQAPEEEKKEEEKKEEEEEGEGALPRQEGGVRRKTRRKKRKRKSRKKKRKSRRKTRKKRRRKSRKKRKTRRRKKGGVKTSAFKKTLKKSPRVLDLQKLTQPKHAKLNIVRGFKQSKPSSLSKQQPVMFRPISPQSQPPLMQQPSEGLAVVQQPQPSLADHMGDLQLVDSDSSGAEEVAAIMNQNS